MPDAGASARDTLGQYPVVILTEKCAGEFGIHCTGVPSGFCFCVCVWPQQEKICAQLAVVQSGLNPPHILRSVS